MIFIDYRDTDLLAQFINEVSIIDRNDIDKLYKNTILIYTKKLTNNEKYLEDISIAIKDKYIKMGKDIKYYDKDRFMGRLVELSDILINDTLLYSIIEDYDMKPNHSQHMIFDGDIFDINKSGGLVYNNKMLSKLMLLLQESYASYYIYSAGGRVLFSRNPKLENLDLNF